MSSNVNKSKFLGIPYGTASAKLRKNIMFMLCQKASMDICFKCNLKIEFVNDLSIEHKLPWENISTELFWNLDNIAFSHLKCNKPHTYNRIESPYGKSWCSGCKRHLLLDEFGLGKRNGRYRYCNSCLPLLRKGWPSRSPKVGRAEKSSHPNI